MAIGTKITLAGAKLLAKALGGKQLKFTRGAFGDAIQGGSMKTPTQAERDALNALIHEKMSLPITDYEIVDDQIIVSLDVKNTGVTEDFRIAEIGLFAEDPDSKQEKLYGYAFQGNDGDKMHATSTDVQLEFQVELVTKICGAENVTAVITRTYEGLQQADLDAHINSTMPHPNWEVVKAGVGLSKSNNTLNVITATTTKLGGIKVGKNLYMEGDSLNAEAGEVDVESRLRQIEINQANLYILLESVHKFGVQGNLIMTDDFQTLKDTRLVEADATISSKGFNFLTDDVSFLRPSSAAIFSDGLLLNQPVNIEGVSLNDDGHYQLRTDTKFNETTARGKVYRSSVTIKDDKAYGAGLVRTGKQTAIKIWKGEGIAETAQVAFNAYPSLESSFTLDGDWSLSADGFFTLD